MVRLIASPMPKPSAFVVKNGSKTRSTSSAAMPSPESCTASSMYGAVGTTVHTVTFRVAPPAAAAMALVSRFRITCWICT